MLDISLLDFEIRTFPFFGNAANKKCKRVTEEMPSVTLLLLCCNFAPGFLHTKSIMKILNYQNFKAADFS
ncbi:hypothetical protein [Flavobacterium subsaxonicum]|uniref:Uncharacterized protein n=1 Tax=Flavobacterium subsaxonicum WB 4.1-42 = DSM 21790 TaxID=1121898 RepID=A0A0A2MPL5_9FLAO|nr:hypothetical protein [Flavobacterium subsaxonicum]KGO94607.1 hypothetical protein Q766_00330 [Flavobacterium subsaxonicum WB 4.1-42 = DSM 21790]